MAIEKKVDEEWKDKVAAEREKTTPEEPPPKADELPQASFFTHITSIATQVMIALGEIEHPVSKKAEERLPEAKFGIDTLGVIEEKTKGNLSEDEERYLDSVLAELRMKYVQAARKHS